MLDANVNPGFKKSWMLRKGIRAQVPDATLQRLLAPRSPFVNIHHQNSETVRYAMMDGRQLGLSLEQLSAPNLHLALVAILTHNWAVAVKCAELFLAAGQRIQAGMIIGQLLAEGPDPAVAALPDWVRPEAAMELRERLIWMRFVWNDMARVDDSDNHLFFETLDVSRDTGLVIPDDNAKNDPAMHTWLENLSDDAYLSKLGGVLANRFSGFDLRGAGGFGVVLAATRHDKSYAIKITRLASPLGDDIPVEVAAQRDEVHIMRIVTQEGSSTRRGMKIFPWLVDWTRGMLDLAALYRALAGPETRWALVPGPGIYLTTVMPLFDFTFAQWLAAAERAAGARLEAYDIFARTVTGVVAAVLAQLMLMRVDMHDFQHNDIKASNLLMRRVPDAELQDSVVSTTHEMQLFDRLYSIRVTAADLGGYAVTLSDFGLSSARTVPPLGLPEERPYKDISNVAAMIPLWSTSGASVLEYVRESLREANDNPALLESVFFANRELSRFLVDRLPVHRLR